MSVTFLKKEVGNRLSADQVKEALTTGYVGIFNSEFVGVISVKDITIVNEKTGKTRTITKFLQECEEQAMIAWDNDEDNSTVAVFNRVINA